MALPFDLPSLSRGYAAITPAARAAGRRAAVGAAAGLGALLGFEVSVEACAAPGTARPRPPATLALDLTALAGVARLEVEPAFVVRLLDRLAGGAGDHAGASALTPLESTALELFALAALEGALATPGLEAALGPRLAGPEPQGGPVPLPGALGIELALAAGVLRGRARLLLPAAAVAALGDLDPAAPAGDGPLLPVSLRRGHAALSSDELAALAPGDVVLLDGCEEGAPGEPGPGALVAPGGRRFTGRFEDESFAIEEVHVGHGNEVPVVLEVELGRLELTWAELGRLEAGVVLPLPVGLDRRGLVALRLGDRAVARGELVEIEGAVGVRVLALEGRS